MLTAYMMNSYVNKNKSGGFNVPESFGYNMLTEDKLFNKDDYIIENDIYSRSTLTEIEVWQVIYS